MYPLHRGCGGCGEAGPDVRFLRCDRISLRVCPLAPLKSLIVSKPCHHARCLLFYFMCGGKNAGLFSLACIFFGDLTQLGAAMSNH